MTQFRSKKDGSHYPLKGGKSIYPKQKLPDNLPKGVNPYLDRQKAMDYYQKGIKVGIQDKRRLDYCLKEVREDKKLAEEKLKDRIWLNEASDSAINWMKERVEKSENIFASEKYSYWKMRAMSPHDASARREWENVGKTGDPKKVLYPKNFFSGYVIGRKLIDDDGKTKSFSYYPRTEHGKPPYWYKTKEEAQRVFKRMKSQRKFPADQSNSVVTKFTEKSYLDRY